MSVLQFFRLLNKNLNIFLLSSLILAVVIFFVTRGLPETYKSRTEIYTGLISGARVDAADAVRLDYLTVSNQFDNLITVARSDQTLEEVGERLFARHLRLSEPVKKIMGESAFEAFHDKIPEKLIDSVYVPGSELETLKRIRSYKEKHYDSWMVDQIFISDASPYSPAGIKKNLTIKRLGGSDLVEMTYSWTDPGICQNTLAILNDVFTQKLIEIKVGQSNDVVTYYRRQVAQAKTELLNAEDSLAQFRIDNKIINYNQQTENIAALQSSLEQEYQQELRVKAAAQASVNQLAKKLELNKKIVDFSEELLQKKKRLSSINAKIAELELYSGDADRIAELRSEAKNLEAELSDNLVKRYEFSRTTEGVSNKEVLQNWLDATITLDASEARLAVLSNRSALFQNAYDQFSPLGAELKRLERAVDVAEKNYLELNSSLNATLTRQQGESLSTGGLVITVPPRFPTSPVRTKQLLMVLLAAVIGFLVPLGFMLILGFLDNTIRTPQRAEEKTGLKLLGAYPELNAGPDYKNVDMEWLTAKALGHIVQNLRHEHHRLDVVSAKEEMRSILFFSTRDREGKSFLVDQVANELTDLNKKVAVLSFKPLAENPERKYEVILYKNDREFLQRLTLDDFIPNKEQYDYIFLNLEAVLTEQYPIELIEQFDMAVCVTSAKRSWNKADEFSLQEFNQVLKTTPRLLINGVAPDYMDSVLGEIKKTRSGLRRFLKTLVTLQFGKRKFETKGTAS